MNEIIIQRVLTAFKIMDLEWLIVVPSAGLNPIYDIYISQERCLFMTREEEAIAVATGLTLGCQKALVLIQQTGVGNALNAVFTLADAYNVFFPIVVHERSQSDVNPVQRVSSQKTRSILTPLGCKIINWHESKSEEKFQKCLNEKCRWIVSQF